MEKVRQKKHNIDKYFTVCTYKIVFFSWNKGLSKGLVIIIYQLSGVYSLLIRGMKIVYSLALTNWIGTNIISKNL